MGRGKGVRDEVSRGKVLGARWVGGKVLEKGVRDEVLGTRC